MDGSLKQDFTRRISQCNKGGMIVIIYDIFFAYVKEARTAYEKKDYEVYKTAVRNGDAVVDTLIKSLNFEYEISKQLRALYMYTKQCLAKAIYQNRLDGILEAEKILKSLYHSFCEAAKTDTSGPLMRNVQQVYAGVVYGRNALQTEYCENNHRGFLV